MEANDAHSLNDLRDMSPKELVQAYKSHPRKPIRLEIRERLRLNQDVDDFLESANLFIAADPGDRPASTFRKEITWRDEFDKYMRPKAEGGHREALSPAQWGLLLERHHWYFGGSIQGVQKIIRSDFLTQLCYENPDCLSGYRGTKDFLSKEASDHYKYSRDKARKQFIDSMVILDIEFSEGRGYSGFTEICYRAGEHLGKWHETCGEDLRSFLNSLAGTANGRWLVGHNLLGWDLPRLQAFMGDDFLGDSPAWDTLVVQSLLEPWLVSQALTGAEKAHEAESDVEANRLLLERQLEALHLESEDYAQLRDLSSSLEEFVGFLCDKLGKNASCRKLPDKPLWLNMRPEWTNLILIPSVIVKDLYWIPGIRFVDSLRGNALDSNNPHFTTRVTEMVIESLSNFALSHGVDLIPDMLPPFARSASAEEQFRRSKFKKSDGIELQTYESLNGIKDLKWPLIYEPFPEMRGVGLLRKVQELSFEDLKVKGVLHVPVLGNTVLKLPKKSNSDLGIIGLEDAVLWLDYHPARRTQFKKWTLWNSALCVESGASENETPNKSRTVRFRCPSFHSNGNPILSPATAKRWEYWKEVSGMVKAILEKSLKEKECCVHILLIQEKEEKEIVAKLFADLGLLPGYGRSKFQLLNSLKEPGKCLVGSMDDVVFWTRASRRSGVKIEFILPELPIYHWAMAVQKDQVTKLPQYIPSPEQGGQEEEDEEKTEQPEDEASDEEEPIIENTSVETPDEDSRPTPIRSENRKKASRTTLPAWAEMLFAERKPWILDPLIAAGCPDRLIEPESSEPLELPILSESDEKIFETYQDKFGHRVPETPNHKVEVYEEYLEVWLKDKKIESRKFKEGTQEPAIQEIAKSLSAGKEGKDVFVGLPTGEGKSVLFQIPAIVEGMASRKLSLVISPLKALMKDQILSLHNRDYITQTAYLSSDLDQWELEETYRNISDGEIILLYVAPERFRSKRFRDAIRTRYEWDKGFGFVVLDEAHCFWLWGNDFRPDYFHAVGLLREDFGGKNTRFLLFSATVTESVFRNVQENLGHAEGELIASPQERLLPVRKFLKLKPIPLKPYGPRSSGGQRLRERANHIAESLEDIDPEKSLTLVFVPMRWQADEGVEHIKPPVLKNGAEWNIKSFHAGLSTRERAEIYYDLKKPRKIDLMITTKAFGMGMDIDDIHRCYHLSPPCYLEDYLQEVGRCGRDSEKLKISGHETIDCHVLWNDDDLKRNTSLVHRSSVSFADIVVLFKQIKESAHLASTGKQVAIVRPSSEKSEEKTKARIALGWLERAPLKRIKILENLPEILELQVKEGISEFVRNKEIDTPAEVISILQRILDQENEQARSTHGDEVRFVGLLLAKDEKKDIKGYRRILLSMHAIFREAGFSSLDDAYHVIGTLVRNQQCIIIKREVDFARLPGAKKGQELLDAGQKMVKQLSKDRSSFSTTIKELSDDFGILLNGVFESEEGTFYVTRLAWAVINTAKYAGIRVKGEPNEKKEMVYKFELSSGTSTAECSAWNGIWGATLKLFYQFESCKSCDGVWKISLDKIIGILSDEGVSRTSVKHGILVLKTLKVIHLSSELFAEAYLVEIVDKGASGDALVDDKDEPIGNRDDTTSPAGVKKRIDENNEFNRLREVSMQLFLEILDEEDRMAFLKDYFDAPDAEFLKENVLEKRLKLLDKKYEGESDRKEIGFINRIRGQIYRESIVEGFNDVRNPESPNQIKICEAKVEQNILVNAGPGSGKTRVLIWRVVHLIYEQKVRPEDILILAFNRAVVSEIITRIRRIFGEIGLGAYVDVLQVHTFHSYARKQWPEGWMTHRGRKNQHDDFMREFIKKIQSEDVQGIPGVLRKAENIRTVLVDEFQDMNEDFFFLLKRLKRISKAKAAIMAIGDDDQDIGRWNREADKNNIKPFSGEYFKRFASDLCVGEHVDPFELLTNFRSARKIVDESQRLLSELDGNRAKTSELKPAHNKEGVIVDGEVNEFDSFDHGIEVACKMALESRGEGLSCAILCRTNSETFEVYVRLKKELENDDVPIRLQAGADLEVKHLRHIAAFLEKFNPEGKLDSEPLDSKIVKEDIIRVWGKLKDIPEVEGAKKSRLSISLGLLRKSFLSELPSATVRDWIDCLNCLSVSEAELLIRRAEKGSNKEEGITLIVSTIHRAKGLEYDLVIIMPSRTEFPFNDKFESVRGDNRTPTKRMEERIYLAKRDEIYLYYVAMTRAKKTLWKGWGDRERHFCRGENYSIETARRVEVLAGLLSEVMISHPSTYCIKKKENGTSDTPDRVLQRQEIISGIEVGAVLKFSRQERFNQISIMCARTQVGLLSKWATKRLTEAYSEHVITELNVKVAAICRWPVDPEWNYSLNSGKEWVTPPEILETQKWFYTLLVTAMPKEFE